MNIFKKAVFLMLIAVPDTIPLFPLSSKNLKNTLSPNLRFSVGFDLGIALPILSPTS